jgi:hypothetical protein
MPERSVMPQPSNHVGLRHFFIMTELFLLSPSIYIYDNHSYLHILLPIYYIFSVICHKEE